MWIYSKLKEIYSKLKNHSNINIYTSNLRNPRIYSHHTNKHINIMYEWKHSSHKCSKDYNRDHCLETAGLGCSILCKCPLLERLSASSCGPLTDPQSISARRSSQELSSRWKTNLNTSSKECYNNRLNSCECWTCKRELLIHKFVFTKNIINFIWFSFILQSSTTWYIIYNGKHFIKKNFFPSYIFDIKVRYFVWKVTLSKGKLGLKLTHNYMTYVT